jgi:hypothetical protein
MLPPLARLPDVQRLFDRNQYFVVHAPRQTGKTTAMRALAEALRAKGVAACWASLEMAQGLESVNDAEPLWIDSLFEASQELRDAWRAPDPATFRNDAHGIRLRAYLAAWASSLDVPLVLMLDEADAVTGQALLSLLRQLRHGFMDRGVGRFPTSVALIGLRDLRDYLAHAKDGRPLNASSPFNISAGSLTLRNFNADEVGELLAQHTAETGQPFETAAVAELHRLTDGQPYLVNALADLCVTDLVPDRTMPITAAHIDIARGRLILLRRTHLDNLAERLKEPRVALIVQPALLGDEPYSIAYDSDDYRYAIEIGLLRRGLDGTEAANPLYREFVVNELSYDMQMSARPPTRTWTTPTGQLDFPALLEAFRGWWRANADGLVKQAPNYPEAVPHLALNAFLQRVVNGGGRVLREFASGRGAMDLLVEYGSDRFAIELKRLRERDTLERIIASGLEQLGAYLDTLGLDHGWLVIFDVRPGRTWDERLWQRDIVHDGRRIVVLGA